MLPRSRMVAALQHREPDRVPIGELAVDWRIAEEALGVKTLYQSEWREWTALWEGRRDEIVDHYVRDLVGLARRFEWDFVVVPTVPPPRKIYPKPELLGDHRWRDDKGRIWRYSPEAGGLPHAEYHPPMSIEDVPDPSAPVTVEDSEFESVERVLKELGDTHLVVARVPDGTFPWKDTIGMAAYLEAMLVDPEFVRKTTAVALSRSLAYIRAAADLGAHAVLTTHDFCDNHGPIMGPRLFKEFVLPALADSAKAAHDRCIYFIKHTDGNLWSILDDMVSAGVDGWKGIQPSIGMDLKLLKEKYGGKLTLIGGVNCDTLVAGSAADVDEEVKYAIRHAARGGGFVMCSGNTLMPGTKFENYGAMVAANRRYGGYPIADV